MKKIFVCSPYRANNNLTELDHSCLLLDYLKAVTAMGHLPFAPHAFFTQFLDDENEEQRKLGIHLGMEMLKLMDEVWVFGDNISSGMKAEMAYARSIGTPIHHAIIRYQEGKPYVSILFTYNSEIKWL